MLISSALAFSIVSAASFELASNASPAAAEYPKGECFLEAEPCPPDPNVGCDIIFDGGLCVATCERPDGSDYRPVVVSKTERPVTGSYDDWCARKASDFCEAFGAFVDNWCWGFEAD